jgi:hypothetical protein
MMDDLTDLQREQMGRYGVPFRSTEAQRRSAVFALSVYNAASFARRDVTVADVVQSLRSQWDPTWAPASVVVTEQTVAAAARWLQERGLAQLDGDMVRIPIRDSRGLGRGVSVDYMHGVLR